MCDCDCYPEDHSCEDLGGCDTEHPYAQQIDCLLDAMCTLADTASCFTASPQGVGLTGPTIADNVRIACCQAIRVLAVLEDDEVLGCVCPLVDYLKVIEESCSPKEPPEDEDD